MPSARLCHFPRSTRSSQTTAQHFMSVIEVDALTKYFNATTAIHNLTFQIEEGTVTGLLGGNGAGKTTTIAILLGLLVPSSGTARVLGHDIVRNRYRVLPEMNFSSPYLDLPQRLSVRDNLRVYAALYSVPSAERRISELADRLNFVPLLERRTGQLSAGQKTRIALAKALINRPRMLLLDEPTASLDPDTADRVRTYLQNYASEVGATILLASHNMGEVEQLCDTVLMLRDGKIVARGTPSELTTRFGRKTLRAVFLDIARNQTEHMPK